jgi:hypothetical protein
MPGGATRVANARGARSSGRGGRAKHGRFFYSRARDCRACELARLCLSTGQQSRRHRDRLPRCSALLRARSRRGRWSEEDQQLYRRHRWRSAGFHGKANTWHGFAGAVRRGL